MNELVVALGWFGVFAPMALGALGSAIGVAIAGQAAIGAMLETDSGYGRFVGVSAIPSSNVIYGIVVMFSLQQPITPDVAGALFGIGFLTGIALLYSGIWQGRACASAIAASKNKPEIFGLSLAPAAIVEGFAVFAFVFALVLAGGINAESSPASIRAHSTASGLESLIARLRDEGVTAGRSEAERLVADAQARAHRILEKAEAESKTMVDAARRESEALRRAGEEALRVAARDAVLDLKDQLERRFAADVGKTVSDATRDEALLQAHDPGGGRPRPHRGRRGPRQPGGGRYCPGRRWVSTICAASPRSCGRGPWPTSSRPPPRRCCARV